MVTEVKIKLLYEDSIMPAKAHDGDAGYDLFVHSLQGVKDDGSKYEIKLVDEQRHYFCGFAKTKRYLVRTGFSMEIPYGYEAQVRPRSGLALNHGVMVVNSPGTIDSPYRGEVGVILSVPMMSRFEIKKGDRIAQMVIQKLPDVNLVVEDSLSETDRGSGGYGSSGT